MQPLSNPPYVGGSAAQLTQKTTMCSLMTWLLWYLGNPVWLKGTFHNFSCYKVSLCLHSGGGGNFVLSSSFVGYGTVTGAGAPMVQHGYGFFYQVRDDR